jgi:hypothetical protein
LPLTARKGYHGYRLLNMIAVTLFTRNWLIGGVYLTAVILVIINPFVGLNQKVTPFSYQ